MLIHLLPLAGNAIEEGVRDLNGVFKNGLLSFLLVTAALIVLTGVVTRLVKKLFQRHGARKGRDFGFVTAFINAILWGFAAFGILDQIVPLQNIAVSLLASSGVAALILGFAAQESVANLISGILIVVYRPVSVGDLVKMNGITGTVEEISLRHTVIRTFENSRMVVPNSVVNSSTLENLTMTDANVCNFLDIGIGYDADADEAMRIMTEEITAHPAFIDVRTPEEAEAGEPIVAFRCLSLGEYSVTLRAIVWSADLGSGAKMLSDLRFSLKKRFAREGIEIPYPYRNLVFPKEEAGGERSDGTSAE